MPKAKAQNPSGKSRNWATIVYPDSAPENWRDTLDSLRVSALISPLHDSDVNADGEPKKPHYHVIFVFDGPTTEKNAQALADQIGAVKVERVASLRSYGRYLCHLDNPEKAQYAIKDVLALGTVDYLDLISSAADVDSAITAMEQWCDDNGVVSYAALCRYARAEKPEWVRILRHRATVHMKAYLQSCQWEATNGIVPVFVEPASSGSELADSEN